MKVDDNMKKKLSVYTAIFMTMVLCIGCGSINSSPEPTPAATNSDVTPIPVTQEQTITKDQRYNDTDISIEFAGLKEYKMLKNKNFIDKPSKGNIFLVLFLKLENNQEDKFFFNENYFSSKIDDKEHDHTILINDPEGYPTFFKNYIGGETDYGFIVWEAPKDWKELSVLYTGTEIEKGITMKMNFKKSDLEDPTEYDFLMKEYE